MILATLILSVIIGMLNLAPATSVYSAAPTATIVVSDPSLKAGETSLVTITFSEAIVGFTDADLTVENGTLSAVSSSDGGITWTATLTPAANISDSTNVITLDLTGVQDANGIEGTGTVTSNNYAVDTLRPTATIVVSDPSLKAGETSLVTITFSEAIVGFTNADLTVENGTLSALSSSDGGITWTATLTPAADISDSTNVITLDNTGVVNFAGNAGTGITISNNYSVDIARPTATIVVQDTALSIGMSSTVTVTFNEPITGLTLTDFWAKNAALSSLSTQNNIEWNLIVTPDANVTDISNVITLDLSGVLNVAGTAGAGTAASNNYAVDTVRPTATIVVADPSLKAGETSLVTITFSEAVTSFTNGDLIVENGTLSTVGSSDGGVTWTATLTPVANINGLTNVITLEITGVTDLAGNAGTGVTTSNSYVVDTTRPTATIIVAASSLKAGETSLVTFFFSEAVTGFTNSDLTVENGTLSTVSSVDGGITWTAILTPVANSRDSTNVIKLDVSGVTNAAGNAGAGTAISNNYVIESEPLTASIVVSKSTLAIGETALVTITFSKPVTGLANADLTVENGTLTGLISKDGGVTWTATLTPHSNISVTTNVITLDNTGVSDVNGNAGTGNTISNPYAVSTMPVYSGNESGGGASQPAPVRELSSTNGQLTLPVNTAGTVSLDNEIKLSIPQGAATQELKITVEKVRNTELLLTHNEMLASQVFELRANNSPTLIKPAKLSLAFDPVKAESDQTVGVFYYDEVRTNWVEVKPSAINGNQISIDMNKWAKYAVLVADEGAETPGAENYAELPENKVFKDMSGHWAQANVERALNSGIITGFPDGTFRPRETVTRSQFAVMLLNAVKSEAEGTELNFTDAAIIGDWARTAVAQAAQAGWINGYEDGTFRPNAGVTRVEMAVMIARALDVSGEGIHESSFADGSDIPIWAQHAVASLRQLGIISGNDNNQFLPYAPTTRAEAVTVLMNILDQNNNVE
ncbi:Ig-like domain-containing protein [Paenibacillus brevis]|nr:Ig-like domain-containing protein [Paenibacillus brevis]